jgi:hypothetical protein
LIKSQLSPKLTSFQKALTAVSLDILHAGIGGRLTPSIQLQEKLEVGSGTVQKALQEISESGGVVLRVKGHQGTIIVDFNPAILWKIAQLEPLRISLTPPGAKELGALSFGIKNQLRKVGIGIEFDFILGAQKRLDTLSKTSYNSALISRGAAKSRNLLDNSNYSILDFGPQSYYQLGSLVMLTSPKIPNPNRLRVALDKNSYDHETLTLNSFRNQKGVEYVDCPFTEVPSVILEGKADTGIWHRVESVISPEQAGLKVSQIDISSLEDEEASISNAVLIWPSSLKEITALLGMIDVELLRQDLQKKAK